MEKKVKLLPYSWNNFLTLQWQSARPSYFGCGLCGKSVCSPIIDNQCICQSVIMLDNQSSPVFLSMSCIWPAINRPNMPSISASIVSRYDFMDSEPSVLEKSSCGRRYRKRFYRLYRRRRLWCYPINPYGCLLFDDTLMIPRFHSPCTGQGITTGRKPGYYSFLSSKKSMRNSGFFLVFLILDF